MNFFVNDSIEFVAYIVVFKIFVTMKGAHPPPQKYLFTDWKKYLSILFSKINKLCGIIDAVG